MSVADDAIALLISYILVLYITCILAIASRNSSDKSETVEIFTE